MLIRLEDKWVRTLSHLPERGMSYQQVHVVLRDGLRVHDIQVFNAEQLDWPEDRAPISSDDILKIVPVN